MKSCMNRPVSSNKKVYTFPSRRDIIFLPSSPVVKKRKLPSSPAMQQKSRLNVQFRPVERVPTHRLVPSHPRNYNFQFLPSRLGPSQFFPRQVVPSRPVSNIVSHEKPCKQGASTDTLGAEIIGLLVACEGQSSMHRYSTTSIHTQIHKESKDIPGTW